MPSCYKDDIYLIHVHGNFFFFFFLPIVFGLTIALEQLIIFDKNNCVEKEPLFSSSATKVLFIESFRTVFLAFNELDLFQDIH